MQLPQKNTQIDDLLTIAPRPACLIAVTRFMCAAHRGINNDTFDSAVPREAASEIGRCDLSEKFVQRIRATLRPVRDAMRYRLVAWASKNAFINRFYYAVINDQMKRETMAVAAGRARFVRERKIVGLSSYLLRRNIHRLEKGLIMRPRRASFAADYIEETIDLYSRLIVNPARSEAVWARDVLSSYFSVVDRDAAAIARAYERWVALPTPLPDNEPDAPRIPFRRSTDRLPVNLEDFAALAGYRRSVRWFLNKPISRDTIDRALEIAAQAPTACNRQPYVFHIFDDKFAARKVAAIPGGTTGFSDNLQAVAVVVGQLRAYPFEYDRHAIYVDGALAVMSFVYALEAAGLASCVVNWPDREPQESRMRDMLGLEDDERVITLVAFGWPDPDGFVARSSKKDLDGFRRYR